MNPRLLVAAWLLVHMLDNPGAKADKVRAAVEYADLLLAESCVMIKIRAMVEAAFS